MAEENEIVIDCYSSRVVAVMAETLPLRKTSSSEKLTTTHQHRMAMAETLTLTSSSTTHQHQHRRSLFGFLASFFDTITTNINLTLISIRRRRSCNTCLPLLLSSVEMLPVYPLLQDIFMHTLFNLHAVYKMIATSVSPSHRCDYEFIAERIYAIIANHNDFSEILPIPQTPDNVFLQKLLHHITIFLSKLHVKVQVFDERTSSIASLLRVINCLFLELKQSLVAANQISMIFPLSFEDLSHTDCDDFRDNVKVIRSNLKNLDMFISLLINKYRDPIKTTQNWIRFTFGAIGFSLFTAWLLRHRSNRVLLPKESNVHQPLTTTTTTITRDITTPNEVMESKQVQSKPNYLQRMLLDFTERTKNSLANASYMVTHRFEKQDNHLIERLFYESFVRPLPIYIQKQKDELERGRPDLKRQLLSTMESISDLYACHPIIFFSLALAFILRRYRMHLEATIEDKGIRIIDRTQTRSLIDQVEQRIMEVDNCNHLSPQTEEEHYKKGLALYSVDRLFRAVRRDVYSNFEWRHLIGDIIVLVKPKAGRSRKMDAISRLKEMYD